MRNEFLRNHNKDIDRVLAFKYLIREKRANQQFLISLINILYNLVVIIIGAYLVVQKAFRLELFIALLNYSSRFTSSLLNLTGLNSQIVSVITSVDRIKSILLKPTDAVHNNNMFETKSIEYRGITFKYGNTFIFKELDLFISENGIYTVVGENGIGKSTLINLLSRIKLPESGEIVISSTKLTNLSDEDFRANIGVFNQTPYLFNDTILNNIRLYRDDISLDIVQKVCEQVGILDFILNCENSFDTLIGERGIGLSEGQRKKVAFARMLLNNPKIMLFDEPFSSLDYETTLEMLKIINEYAEKCIIIMIDHNLSHLDENSKVIYISPNREVINTTHSDLLRNVTGYSSHFKDIV